MMNYGRLRKKSGQAKKPHGDVLAKSVVTHPNRRILHPVLIKSPDGSVSEQEIQFKRPDFTRTRRLVDERDENPRRKRKITSRLVSSSNHRAAEEIEFMRQNISQFYSEKSLSEIEDDIQQKMQDQPVTNRVFSSHVAIATSESLHKALLQHPPRPRIRKAFPLSKIGEIMQERANGKRSGVVICSFVARVRSILPMQGREVKRRHVIVVDINDDKCLVQVVFWQEKLNELRKLRIGEEYILGNFAVPRPGTFKDIEQDMAVLKTIAKSVVIPNGEPGVWHAVGMDGGLFGNIQEDGTSSRSVDPPPSFTSVTELLESRYSGKLIVKAHIGSIKFTGRPVFDIGESFANLSPCAVERFSWDDEWVKDILGLVFLSCRRCGEEVTDEGEGDIAGRCGCDFYAISEDQAQSTPEEEKENPTGILWAFHPIEIVIRDDDNFHATLVTVEKRDVISSLLLLLPEKIAEFKKGKGDQNSLKRLRAMYTALVLGVTALIEAKGAENKLSFLLDRILGFDANDYVEYVNSKLLGIDIG